MICYVRLGTYMKINSYTRPSVNNHRIDNQPMNVPIITREKKKKKNNTVVHLNAPRKKKKITAEREEENNTNGSGQRADGNYSLCTYIPPGLRPLYV